MEEEFLTHRRGSEWWYSTGYLSDESGRMFAFQFTLARIRIYVLRFHVLLTSLTDIESGRHYNSQETAFLGRNVVTTAERTAFGDKAEIAYGRNAVDGKGHMQLRMSGENYSLALDMNAVKPPVWHCDGGVLKMGILDDPRETTYYYSYTNLASKGRLILDGTEHDVTGKSWFDKQGGRYTLTDRRTSWEWFSLRFFDGEEIMLFAFPQDDHFDGTYIGKTGEYRRLNSYTVAPLGFREAGGYRFSNGWKVTTKGVKDEEYTLTPVVDGQFNVFFFEMLAEIRDKTDRLVGYSFVELLPGVYNEKMRPGLVLKRV
jgi:predicted secreted hydrolase